MERKDVLVTGGAGFIGSHLVDALIARHNNVTVFDDLSGGKISNLNHCMSNPRLHFVKGDITNRRQVFELMEQHFDYIFHLAAVVGVEKYCKDPLKTIDVNFLGTRYLTEAALNNNAKFVFASTSEIYGKNPEMPLREDGDRVLGAPNIARWSYSSSKALCEHLLFALYKMHDLPTVIVRPFNVYGPRQRPPLVIASMMEKVVRGKPPVVYGSGTQTRTLTYVKDVVEGILLAADSKDAEGEVLNLASTDEISILDLAKMIIDLSEQGDILRPVLVDYSKHYGTSYEDIGKRVPDVSKSERLMGWRTTTSLKDGLLKTIKYWRTEGKPS